MKICALRTHENGVARGIDPFPPGSAAHLFENARADQIFTKAKRAAHYNDTRGQIDARR